MEQPPRDPREPIVNRVTFLRYMLVGSPPRPPLPKVVLRGQWPSTNAEEDETPLGDVCARPIADNRVASSSFSVPTFRIPSCHGQA